MLCLILKLVILWIKILTLQNTRMSIGPRYFMKQKYKIAIKNYFHLIGGKIITKKSFNLLIPKPLSTLIGKFWKQVADQENLLSY